MYFDFSAFLFFATVISGLIWGVYRLVFAPKRQLESAQDSSDQVDEQSVKLPLIVEYAKSLFPVFLIVFLLRSFLFEPFKIPSSSMMPTLLIGDFVLVNKYDYGLRFPPFYTKFIANKTPKRGDVIVFRYPQNPKIPYIKRVVGIPGDAILYWNKSLYINGIAIEQILNGRYNAVGAGRAVDGWSLRTEQLGELRHQILINPDYEQRQNISTRVPAGHYFVLGDNRDNSRDSRFWGFVPDENLVGRAFMIWMNWDGKNSGIDFSRIGKSIE